MILELFSGAGCASLGIAAVTDEPAVGIEWDRWACATRAAAGLVTIRADVSQVPTAPFAGKVTGLWGSPPCPTFSAAGLGAGIELLDLLAEAMRAMCRGEDTRGETERRCIQRLADGGMPLGKVMDAAAMSVLVLEPARFAHDLRPDWIACEQVPAALPLWRAMGHGLAALGYGWWAGVLDAADFGVPQNRKRAILMARQGVNVTPPEPTHFDQRKSPSLFGEPHVSMADALGWGMTERPGITVAVGTGGGPDPQGAGGSGARRTVARARAGTVE